MHINQNVRKFKAELLELCSKWNAVVVVVKWNSFLNSIPAYKY